MRKKFSTTLAFLTVLTLILAPYGSIKAKAAVSSLEIPNNYEIAVAGTNLDAVVDSAGNAYVVFERSGNIYLVKNRGSEQLIGAGSSPSIAMDNSGNPHIAYISSGSVIYETFDGDWDNEVNVGIGTGATYADIDIDSNGKAHVFARAKYYNDGYCSSITDIVYFSNASGSFSLVRGWNGESCYDNPDRHYYDTHPISIAIDNLDNYHLLFWHRHNYVTMWDRDNYYYIEYHTNIPGALKNLGGNHTLYKNSLAIDALGRANVIYDGAKHGLISGGTWTETNLTTASNPSIASNNSAIAIAYTSSGINYYENNGVGMGQTIQIDAQGDNSVVALNDSNRFIYYIKNGKIYLATDKTIFNAPIISGVNEGEIYNSDREISWDHGSGNLNGTSVSSPITVSNEGAYNITVVNSEGKSSSINFSIDKTAPIITINPYNTTSTNQDIIVTASTNEGTLNTTSHTFTDNGSFEFIATDTAGNQSSEIVTINNIDKVAPTIKIDFYSTDPTNQDITVTATTNEGTLNVDSHTFSQNGSFDFIATDIAGNQTTYTVTISNIDKEAPTITIDPFSTAWTNQDVTVTASTNEGMLNATSHTFTENGSFNFVSTDSAGNQTTTTVSVSNIDKIKPTGATVTSPSSGSHVHQTIIIEANATDNQSGIEKVEFISSLSGKIAEDNTLPYETNWDTTLAPEGEHNIWIRAYDIAGNISDSAPLTINVDNTAPVITIDAYNTTITNQDIIVTATTNEGTLNTTSHTFSQNGSFDFIATDLAGNQTTESVTISNIDKTAPVITINPYSTAPTNQDVTVTASTNEGMLNATSHTFIVNGSFDFVATDDAGNTSTKTVTISNIDKIAPVITIQPFPVASTNQNITVLATTNEGTLNTNSHTFTENGSFEFVATDEAGNISSKTVTVSNIDKIAPIITIDPYSTTPTNQDVTVTATTNEGTLNNASHTFSENGSFEFIATDDAGNQSSQIVTINNIDKTGPTIIIGPYSTAPTNQDVTVTASVSDGTLNASSHTFSENGSFEFVATDDLGNTSSYSVTISNIDKAPPKGAVSSLTTGQTLRSTVSLIASAIDDGSGIEKIEFYHASTETLIGTATSSPFSINWDTTKLEDGAHKVWSVSYDRAGNSTVSEKIDIEIDNTAPVITITPYSLEPTSGSVTVYASVDDGTLNSVSHIFTENGSFIFIASDSVGNISTKTVTITHIIAPQNNVHNTSTVVTPINNLTQDTSLNNQINDANNIVPSAQASEDTLQTPDQEKQETLSNDNHKTESSDPEVKGEKSENKTTNNNYLWWIALGVAVIAMAYFLLRGKRAN